MTEVWQFNLQRHFGGGEVYTRFLCQAMAQLGWQVHLFVHCEAEFWQTLDLGDTQLVPVSDAADAGRRLPDRELLVLTHGSPPESLAHSLRPQHRLAAIAHMPMRERNAEPYRHADIVFGVSGYVIQTLIEKGIEKTYPAPLWGVASPIRSPEGKVKQAIIQQSHFDWDERKLRDKTLGLLYPGWQRIKHIFAPAAHFQRRPGITLGIVSRLTPIKQFPLLMQYLAPLMARHPLVNLEIFGAGGYASVRDLKTALAPLIQQGQVRFWGYQSDVAKVYSQLDYLLSGLPEKEALGLNIIESQWCGTPVIAVDAPPFDETVAHQRTGFLYLDPRQDQGDAFEQLLKNIASGELKRPKPLQATEHLQQFSFEAFSRRISQALPLGTGP